MKLPQGMTTPEIRILQEFRRLETSEMEVAEIRAIKHPAKVDDEPLQRLEKGGFLTSSEDGHRYRLTEAAKSFLARPSEPEKDRWGKES